MKTSEQELRFSVENFAPAWGAVVMGTGVISSSFAMLQNHNVVPDFSSVMAIIFLVVALLLAVPILGLTAWRWIRYPQAVMADMKNPVKGAMSATFAGGFLVLASALGRAGMSLFGAPVATFLVYLFASIGILLTVIIGMLFLTDLLARGDTAPPMITGAWFIPPVVTVVVPVALAPVITTTSRLHMDMYWASWGMLGVGSLLYVIIAATIFYRSTTHSLPPQALAPTLVIGMGPPGLIALDLLLLHEVTVRLGIATTNLASLTENLAMMLWAFGFAWGLAALVVILRGIGRLKFALSWWGFTFPLGAWVVSGLALGFLIDSPLVWVPSVLGLVIMLVLWAVILVQTARGIKANTIWD